MEDLKLGRMKCEVRMNSKARTVQFSPLCPLRWLLSGVPSCRMKVPCVAVGSHVAVAGPTGAPRHTATHPSALRAHGSVERLGGRGCTWARKSPIDTDPDLSRSPDDTAPELPLRSSRNHKEIKNVSLWEVPGADLAYCGDCCIYTHRVTALSARS